MVFRDNHRLCPRCNAPLEEMRTVVGHRFLRCQACNGNWVATIVLREMFDRLKPGEGMPGFLTRDDDGEVLLRCPTCDRPMARRKLARLALDQCDAHGVWFDGRELEDTLYTYAIAD